MKWFAGIGGMLLAATGAGFAGFYLWEGTNPVGTFLVGVMLGAVVGMLWLYYYGDPFDGC